MLVFNAEVSFISDFSLGMTFSKLFWFIELIVSGIVGEETLDTVVRTAGRSTGRVEIIKYMIVSIKSSVAELEGGSSILLFERLKFL